MAFIPNPVPVCKTFKEVLDRMATSYGDRDVFREKDGDGIRSTSLGQFRDMICGLGTSLDIMGLLNGKVALLGETSVKWIAAYFAQVCGGGVIVPIDRELPDEEIAAVLEDSGAQAVIFSPSYAQTMEAIAPQLGSVRYYIPMEGEFNNLRSFSYDRLVKAGSESASGYLDRATDPEEMAALLYTSGTTGAPKGVMLSQQNITAAASNALKLIDVGDTCLSVLPIQHTYEFTHGVVMMFINGTTICISDSLRYFAANLRLFRPDTLLLVPLFVKTLYSYIWNQAEKDGQAEEIRRLYEDGDRDGVYARIRDYVGGRLRVIISGGAPLAVWYPKAFDDMGFDFLEGYGITECAPLVSVNPNRCKEYDSIGLPIPCCTIRLDEFGSEGEGEICVKGPNVMIGYYKDPQATAEVMRDGWFHTGDLGRLDEKGYLHITGRRKDLIVLENGKNVHPEEIEGYLTELPLVTEAVVWAPMDAGGTQKALEAEIYVGEAAPEGADEAELYALLDAQITDLNHRIPGYKQIVRFHIRPQPFEKTTKKSIKRFRITGSGPNLQRPETDGIV